jgi:hypothetical protein
MIRPVVTYASGIGTLTTKDENNLPIFERQILKKIKLNKNQLDAPLF